MWSTGESVPVCATTGNTKTRVCRSSLLRWLPFRWSSQLPTVYRGGSRLEERQWGNATRGQRRRFSSLGSVLSHRLTVEIPELYSQCIPFHTANTIMCTALNNGNTVMRSVLHTENTVMCSVFTLRTRLCVPHSSMRTRLRVPPSTMRTRLRVPPSTMRTLLSVPSFVNVETGTRSILPVRLRRSCKL